MARPTRRDGSLVPQFRRRVPLDIIDVVRGKTAVFELPAVRSDASRKITVKIGDTIKFSLRTREPREITERNNVAAVQFDRLVALWRSGGALDRPNFRQLVALSGEVYRLYIERFTDNPRTPAEWAAFKAFNRAASEGRLQSVPTLAPAHTPDLVAAVEAFGADLTSGVDALPVGSVLPIAALERRFGLLADWVLQKHEVSVDHDGRMQLLVLVGQAATDAGWQLKRNASGDYTPDPKAARFPPTTILERPAAISLEKLYEKWENETNPSASTRSTWGGVLRSLSASLGEAAKDITTITDKQIVEWKDQLVARGLKPKTINSSYLGMANAILQYGLRNKLISVNPALGVSVASKRRAGESMLPYTDEEVRRLLSVAALETGYKRWIPWLAASSGARVGELAQLWGSRIRVADGIHYMVIAPAEDGGSLKNEGSEREVPIHPQLIEDGFLDFVRSKGNGPLFYRRSSGRSTGKHVSKGVSNHLATWIRSKGYTDPRKAPNHAFRHWFKSAAVRAGISDNLANVLQGHSSPDEASRYRHYELATKAEAISGLMVPPHGSTRPLDKTDTSDHVTQMDD